MTQSNEPVRGERVEAPWSQEQVHNLRRWQQAGFTHPFTCARAGHGGAPALIPTTHGWVCPEAGCEYRQTWAYDYMLDGSYVDQTAAILRQFAPEVRTDA